MRDKSVRQTDRLLAEALRKIGHLYPDALAPVMEKHKATFAKLDKLEQDGAWGRARTLIRTSGLMDDLVHALAKAGRTAADVIRAEMSGVREVAADGDDEGSPGESG